MRTNAATGSAPSTPAESTWALLTKNDLTWRQATEGWAVLATLGSFGLLAVTLIKTARLLGRSAR